MFQLDSIIPKHVIDQLQNKLHIVKGYQHKNTRREKKINKNGKCSITDLQNICIDKDLAYILTYINMSKILPDKICLENTVLNANNVMTYMCDNYNYIPDVFTILKVPTFEKRYLLMSKFYPDLMTIQYDVADNKRINITPDNLEPDSDAETKANKKTTKKIIVNISSDESSGKSSSESSGESSDELSDGEITVKKVTKKKIQRHKSDDELINLD